MKILMYSVRDDEMPAINAWAKRNQVTVATNQEDMSSQTVGLAQGYDGVVIVQHAAIDSAVVYQKLHEYGIKQLGLRSAGYDVVDLPAAKANDLIVTNVPAYSPRSVAEYSLAQTFRLIRNLELFDARGAHQDFRWGGLIAHEIHTLTIGIIGAGRIGGTAARLFHALGATVLANDLVENDDLKDILTYVDKETLLKKADVVDLHPDLNPSSTHLLSTAEFKLMKPSAVLINASRGPVIDTKALVTALKEKQLAGVAIDAIEGEQEFNNFDLTGKTIKNQQFVELRKMPNVILTPHIGFYTNVAVQNMVDISLDDAKKIIEGGQATHPVD
ncbi:D-2-hydroxyacid dehydrogenase [Loigolactobacillus iwatensis]|uniref:D-2-hydroxyacid dehydrogenase n=1 Tax=Loigolactobacillus iwatensis TaxID=1267156 RepID=UPI000F7D8CAF|nr:D-2-hydroxyacid dehydrogenase [Loigolactobacillus iwatensis]